MYKHVRYLVVSVFTLCFMASTNAGVVEKSVSLPNNLGAATVFSNNSTKGSMPAVIVIHEWWGFNQYAKDRAKMLAEQGYTAIAVDMYGHGKVAEHPQDAQGFMQSAMAKPELMNARFDAAKEILKQQANVDANKIFAMGYCFGGSVVLNQARLGNDLAGVASFHGSLQAYTEAKPGDIKARVFVAHGGADPMVPPEQAAGIIEEMVSLGVDIQFYNYPTAKHAFTNPAATEKGKQYNLPLAYDEHADIDSWAAFLKFLAQ